MGTKGDKQSNFSAEAMERFVSQVAPLGDVTSKKMFGGYGVFEGGTMFALVTAQGGVHLKATDANRGRFEEAGAAKHARMPYYLIPEAVMESDSQLLEWTREAIAVSKAGKK